MAIVDLILDLAGTGTGTGTIALSNTCKREWSACNRKFSLQQQQCFVLSYSLPLDEYLLHCSDGVRDGMYECGQYFSNSLLPR